MKPLALTSIRTQNLRTILDLLTLSPAMTRQELAEASGLSLMTVTNLVDLLKEQQVLTICQAQRQPAVRVSGRKAEWISLCGDHKAWLMVDLSGRQFCLTLTGFDIHPLLEMQDEHTGDYLPRLESFLQEARFRLSDALGGRSLLGVSIVTPGPYEIASDTVTNQRLPELNGIRIKELFQRCLGNYEYYVDEDVKFAVRAYTETTAQQQCEVLYYLYIGEGVGGASVHSGNMLRGLNATAGDAGQLTDATGSPYEQRLCLSAFMQQLKLDTSALETGSIALSAAARQQPECYQDALRHMAAVTAEMLHGVLWMLDPTHIVIDCRYSAPFSDLFIDEVTQQLRQRFAGTSRQLPDISSASQSISSILRGAVHVLQREWVERILA